MAAIFHLTPPTVRTLLDLTADELDQVDPTDPEVTDLVETVTLDGWPGDPAGRRLTATDLLVWTDALRRLADRIDVLVMDERQARLEAERSTCHFCGTPGTVEPGEETCGSVECDRRLAVELRADLMGWT